MITLLPAPTIATIDEKYNLIANWQPYTVNGTYAAYAGWDIILQTPPTSGSPITTTVANTGTPFSFTQQVSAGDYAMNMTAVSSDLTQYTDSAAWDSSHTFPAALLAANVSFDNTNLLLGQTFTITLNSSYSGANSWQVLFPDGTSTGWLPLSTRSVAKSLNTAGAQNVIIQTQNSFGTANPPVNLRRQLTQQIYVVDQQYNPTSTTQGVLTGTLGIGGDVEFEITEDLNNTTVAQPYEVVVRSIARDTVTNELKLMVATSRYSNASSLLGTMAVDVFPMVGRPHAKELIEPSYVLEVVSATSSIPVSITTTTLPSNIYVGKPMTEFPMVASGGTLNYSWAAVGLPPGLKINLGGTINGTPTQLGTFDVTFAVMDSSIPAFIAESTFAFTIPTDLLIISASPLPNATVGVAYSGVQLANSGGLAPFTWNVVAGALPIGMIIDPNTGIVEGTPCTYTSVFPNTDYTESYNFVIQVTDAINSKASQNFSLKLAPAPLALGPVDQPLISASEQYKLAVPVFGGHYPYTVTGSGVNLVDGQLEYLVTPTTADVGLTNSFTVVVSDSSSTPQYASGSIYYKVEEPISAVYVAEAFFDNYWDATDTTAVTHAIVGNLSGFSIQSSTTVLSNGLTLDINGPAKTVTVTGPATGFSNNQVPIQLPVLQGSTQVATITREYTLLTHDATFSSPPVGSPPLSENIGTVTNTTRPYIVGNVVGLNPLKPWFNSPSLSPANVSGYTARVQSGSTLPPGLSFDSNTTLIYGTLSGTTLAQSVIEYVDVDGAIQGTVAIVWDITKNAFATVDNLIDMGVQTPVIAGASTISAPSITSCSVYRGRLPLQANGQQLSLVVDPSGSFVSIVGTPTEAGYFDVWFLITSQNGTAILYHRLFVDYINPLTILTTTLPTAVISETYSFQLQGFGGIPFSAPASPYSWSMTGNPGWISLSTSGVLSVSGTVPIGSTSATLNFTITDSRGVTATASLPLTVVNSVVITTTVLPTIEIGVAYSFTMSAVGGVHPYTWSCPSLAGAGLDGITLNASTGVISGTASSILTPTSITITVTDSGTPVGSNPKTLTLQTGAQGGMYIESSGVGPIDRGAPYQGSMTAVGTTSGVPVLPVSWSVTGANPLPTGLSLQVNTGNRGTTAAIVGTITAVLVDYAVTISAVDSIGNPATVDLLLTTFSSLAVTTTSLPQGIVSVPYSAPLTATGVNTPITWSSPSLPSGLTISQSINGLTATLSGTPSTAFSSSVTFNLSDSLTPPDTATKALNLILSASTLIITTASPLPQGTAGLSYTTPLAATGGVSPYTWSVSPASANPLPSGLSVSGASITGTTTFVGTTSITIRVTDHVSSYYDKVFSLTFISGLNLKTGIDYTDSLTTNSLGYIDAGSTGSISPRTNRSFYVIATGVITTSVSALQAGITITNYGFSASVSSLSGGVAYILITGPFASGVLGSNTFGISVTDSGVTATKTFNWTVYIDGSLQASATNAFPTQLV